MGRMQSRPRRVKAAIGLAAIASLVLAGCGSSDDTAAGDGETVNITLITKDPSNAFWTSMIEGANTAAGEVGAQVTVASGRDQTDADSQIQAIENAISRGDDGILIANNGPAVNDAITKARNAGIYVVALDTATTPTDIVDATFATDNRKAGRLIGQYTAKALGGRPAVIALLDLFGDKVVAIDYERDQGFLDGMGVPLGDADKNGDEAKTGNYSGGTYTIACNQPTDGAEDGGRSAMENCLSTNPDINVVFTANETSGRGAVQALKAAGNSAVVTSLDGSCAGVKSVTDGEFGAVSQQYPGKMGDQGVRAVVEHVRNGTDPTPTEGLDYVDTGVALVTRTAVEGVESIDAAEGEKLCW